MPSKRFIFILVSVFLSCIVALMIFITTLEIYLRWDISRVDDYNGSPHPGIYTKNEIWGYNYQPGIRFRVKHLEFSHIIDINKLGFRGGEDKLPRYQNLSLKKGILLGDSYMFGMSITENDLLINQLAKNQNNYKWYNFSVAGWGTLNQKLVLEHYIDLIEPNIVILAFFENDFFNNIEIGDKYFIKKGYLLNRYCPNTNNPIPEAELRRITEMFVNRKISARRVNVWLMERCREPVELDSLIIKIKRFLHESLESYDFLEPKVKYVLRKILNIMPEALRPYLKEYISHIINLDSENMSLKNIPELPQSAITKTKSLLREMRDLCWTREVELKAFLIPSKWLVNRSNNPYLKVAQELLDELSIEHIDMTPLIKANGGKELYWKKDGHLRPEGHLLITDVILKQNWF